MTEEIKISKKDVVACNYWKACDYYKQLIRIEQENENLKKEVKQIGSDFIKKGDYARELEQENKELSFAIEKCLENAGIECDDEEQALRSLPMLGNAHYKVLVEKEALEQENKELKAETLQWKQIKDMANNNKYRSALEEIKKAIKSYYLTVDNGASVDTLYTIRKIINEVLQ